MAQTLDTVLLFALPASGKSEVRKYMDGLSPERCREDMHMGPTLQLDDYPYVHFMHRIDDELVQRGWEPVFYHGPTRPFQEQFSWGVLIEMLNQDYADLMAKNQYAIPSVDFPSAAQLLFDRFDDAREKAGLDRELDMVPHGIRRDVAEAMEEEVLAHFDELNRTFSTERTDHTIIIEAARGGQNGAAFPLTPPRGYQYALSMLSEEILDRANILYVWVTPEESRRKNIERGRPDGQGSILFHSVPQEVMLDEYGCDDMQYLIEQSDRPNTVKVERIVADGDKYTTRVWNLPVGRFDNREDLTSFVREPKESWKSEEADRLHGGLASALGDIAKAR